MVDKKDLRGNLVRMREVAELLSAWADDMEKALADADAGDGAAGASDGAASGASSSSAAVSSSVSSGSPAGVSPVALIPLPKEMTFGPVREYLGKVSAVGYTTQVQALVNSFGAVRLSKLDPVHFPALVEAVSMLGGDADAG